MVNGISGAKIGIVTIRGVEYIRTQSDGTPADNLDNFASFLNEQLELLSLRCSIQLVL